MKFKNTFFYCFIALLFSCFYILTTTQVPAMVHVGISWFTGAPLSLGSTEKLYCVLAIQTGKFL